MAWHALAGQADELARVHAGRDLDVQRALLPLRTALRVELQRAQRDLALGAAQRVFERDLDRRMVVFAAGAEVLPRGAAALGCAEQRGIEVAEVGVVGRSLARAAMELEARVPVGRRFEPARRTAAGGDALGQRVVRGALVLVAQHVVGFVDLAHALLGVGLGADVGVILAGQLAIGLAHLVVRRGAIDAQGAVVVFEVHGARCVGSQHAARTA
jgi:hypothetical protein